MKLADVLAPLTVADFEDRYFARRALVRVAEDNPFGALLTLDELEARLNDGCANLVDLAVIGRDGVKLPHSDIYAKQTGRAWTPMFLRKARFREYLEQGLSCVLHNMSHITPRTAELVASIEDTFPGYQADVHVYVSPRASATSFRVHRDQPQHKLYLQLVGKTDWTVYRGRHEAVAMSVEEAERHLAVDFQVTLTEGSVLYLPPGVYHRVENPWGPRVSLSVPFYESSLAQKVDRSHVPLAALFRAGARAQ